MPPQAMRARCSAFLYCPDPLGIVLAEQLDKLEFDEECDCMKKLIALLLATVLLLSLVACGGKTIGEVRGAENEYITIDDVKYVLDADNDFSQADKGTYLGKVSNAKITMKVYSVKGDAEAEYIYAVWDWEGAFYKKEQ